MSRRDCLLRLAAALFAALVSTRASADARPFDALCDERGVPLATEGGDRLRCG